MASIIKDGIERMPKNSEHPYTRISNEVLQNKALSFEAKGMLVYLLSKPDDWVVRVNDLVNASPAGKAKTRRIIKELEGTGYLLRDRVNDGDENRYYWHTRVYESPGLNPWHLE